MVYQQVQLVLQQESDKISKLWATEQAISQLKRDRRREWFADMCLFSSQAVRSVGSLLRPKRAKPTEKVSIQAMRDRRKEWLSDFRLFAFAMTRSVLSFWGIMGWMAVGTIFGGVLAHNFLSQAVLCNKPMCMWLRFDGEKVLE